MRTIRLLFALLISLPAYAAPPPQDCPPLPVDASHTTGDFKGCPPEGKGKKGPSGKVGPFDPDLDRLKNRDLPPAEFEDLAVSDLLDNVPAKAVKARKAKGGKKRACWPQDARDEVAEWEGKGARVEGYLLNVVEESEEACNCRKTGLANHDFHMWLVESRTDDRTQAIVIEVSPRLRPSNPAWDLTTLKDLANHTAKVRISGWLMWDHEHPEQLKPAKNRPTATRGTLWEIHPIHKIEVRTSGKWKALE